MKAIFAKRPTTARARLIIAGLALSLTLASSAQDYGSDSIFPTPLQQTQKFGIWPFVGYRFGGEVEDESTGKDYSFENSTAFGLCLDYAPPNYHGRFELLWSHQDSSLDFDGDNGLNTVDVTIDVVQVGGVLEFGKERLRAYLSAHAGGTYFSAEDHDDEIRFSFGIGVGGKAYFTKNMYVRADFRGFCTVVDSSGSFISANGVTVATFSGSTFWQAQVSAGVGITF
ncbi:MAG TPA: outer membrane beta-barrel protein [Verrucomicrobiota bacterium]|nr:outer membrane beta-barrel protein [Verrucomicrobiota bacterium]